MLHPYHAASQTCEICTKTVFAFLAFAAFFAYYQPITVAIKSTFAIAIAIAIAATSVSKIHKLHKIHVQNLKKLQKFANLPRIFWKPITNN